MKKIVFILLSVSFMFSCEDPSVVVTETSPDVRLIDGRIAFSSEDIYFSTLDQLANGTETDLKEWEGKFKFVSLRNFLSSESEERNVLHQLPTSHQLILNNQGIVQVGSEIVWFKEGVKYYLSVEKFNRLQNIEDIATIADRKGIFKQSMVEADEASARAFNTRDLSSVVPGVGGDQHEFGPNGSNPSDRRKYVTEFISTYETGSSSGNICLLYDTRVTLNCRIKMEWKSSKGWKPAGDPRNLTWNINPYNLTLSFLDCIGANVYIPITGYASSGSVTGFTSYYKDVQMASYRNYLLYAPAYGFWTGNVTGTVYQNMTNAVPLHPYTVTF